MLLGSVSWLVKGKNFIKIDGSTATIFWWMFDVRVEEYHGRVFTDSNISMVWSSRKNGREFLL